MAFIEFRDVEKHYKMGEQLIRASNGVTFDIEEGEFCVIVGASGAGKTTVLNMLGGMDSCDGGTITLAGDRISAYDQKALTKYRRLDVGFVSSFTIWCPT